MKRTTVMLPLELKARAERLARARGISFGELVRRSLSAAVEPPAGAKYDEDPLLADSVVFEGNTPEDLSGRHDTYLYGTDE